MARAAEVATAQRDSALDALELLVGAFSNRSREYASPPQQSALRAACRVLAENGRGL